MRELSKDNIQQIRTALLAEVSERPLTIGVVGVSGVGKSSTINALFKTHLKVSHTVAGTKTFGATDLSLQVAQGHVQGESVKLIVVDAPGMGEDLNLDNDYIQMYKNQLPSCDVILWVLSARNRAIALDQMYLQKFEEFAPKIVFGINQIDLVHPMDWEAAINLPSVEMEQNINEIVTDRTEKLKSTLNVPIKVVPYSAARGYNLEPLFAAIIEAVPFERQWLYDGLKNFSYRDFLPQGLEAEITASKAQAQGDAWFAELGERIRHTWTRFCKMLSQFFHRLLSPGSSPGKPPVKTGGCYAKSAEAD